jgi:hypothetical protein
LHSPVPVIHYEAMKALLRSLTRPAVASALVALALTALLYGDALALPLFSDDLVQIPWLESTSWRDLWTSPSPYGYYRPAWYSLWRMWGLLVGGLHPLGLHFLNVAAHFVASWLAGLLTAAWVRPGTSTHKPCPYSTCLATGLFAAFPFSRQAVAWPGAVYNPLVSAMAAGVLLAYDRGRQIHAARWIALALLLAALSAFTYEAGLLVGPLAALAEIVGWAQHRWERRRSWWPLAFVALFALTTLIWRAMRGAGATGFGLNPTDLRRNVGFLAQGLIYPTAPLAQRLTAWRGFDPDLSLWLVALPTLTLLILSGLRRNCGALLLGAGWFALFALPPLVSMEADWFALAPRFLYMTAGGVSLVWMTAASEWLPRLRPSWCLAATGVLLVVLLVPAGLFVRDGMRLYAMAGESVWNAAGAAKREQPVLLVNLPTQITPHGRTYPLGFEGVTPLPARVAAEGLAYVHTGIHDAARAVSFGIVAPEAPPDYTYQLFGEPVGWEELTDAVRQVRSVYLTRYEPDRIHLIEAGALSETVPPGEPLARFRNRVAMLEASPICDAGGQVRLTIYWQVETPVERDIAVFAHLLDAEGTLVAQADGYPLLGMLPFWLWKPGEVMRDVHHFDPVPAGAYTIRLGLWESATGERWVAEEHPDGVVLLPIHCP